MRLFRLSYARSVTTLCALALLAAPAGAAGDERPVLVADSSHTGYIDLLSFGAEGTRVSFFERLGARRLPLGSAGVAGHGSADLPRATTWRCDRVVRRFEAVAIDAAGVRRRGRVSLRTPSCRHRFGVEAPRRNAPGRPLTVRVVDAWGIGATGVRLCARRPEGRETCRRVRLRQGSSRAQSRLRLRSKGIWRLTARHGTYAHGVAVGVGMRAPRRRSRPVVLATGDSTIQGIESFLEDRLPAGARMAREYFPGTGISRPLTPWWPYWPTLAQRQAQERVPRLTVISIGANDGHPMDAPDGRHVICCEEAWIAEYARRVREVMAAFVRGGEGRVLWLTLPAPRHPERRDYAAAVNSAIRSAASGRPHVRLVELDRILTPGFRFRERMQVDGRRARVREGDGIHLTAQGTELAAREVASAIRRWRGALR